MISWCLYKLAFYHCHLKSHAMNSGYMEGVVGVSAPASLSVSVIFLFRGAQVLQSALCQNYAMRLMVSLEVRVPMCLPENPGKTSLWTTRVSTASISAGLGSLPPVDLRAVCFVQAMIWSQGRNSSLLTPSSFSWSSTLAGSAGIREQQSSNGCAHNSGLGSYCALFPSLWMPWNVLDHLKQKAGIKAEKKTH